jgi:ATPases with chaperone activity, ATP-binding subunit
LARIVDLELAKVEKRLKIKDIHLRIAVKVKKKLAEKGYDTTFGARPLKRIIQNMILDELALDIIEGKIKEGDKVFVDLGVEDKLQLKVS